MRSHSVRHIKHAQRESFYYRELVKLLHTLAADDPLIRPLFITSVSLSASQGSCTVLLGTSGHEDSFDEQLRQLILYKPSLRTSLAKITHTRRVPELHFKFDQKLKKQQRLHEILETLKKDGSVE